MKQKLFKIIILFCVITVTLTGNVLVSNAKKTNDPYLKDQWYLSRISAYDAWETTTGSSEVVIAVIDSGVDIDHPDLVNNIWENENEIPNDNIDNDYNGYVDDYNGWDFLEDIPDPRPKINYKSKYVDIFGDSHGTMVAGIIAASGNNNKGIAGISWKSKIMPLRVLDQHGAGRALQVSQAIDYAVSNGADIINLSFTGLGSSELISNAIYRAYTFGKIIIAPAGNTFNGESLDLDKIPITPVCADSEFLNKNIVIGVASTGIDDRKSSFSNYGSSCINISSPGFGFYVTLNRNEEYNLTNDYGGFYSGTSLASPIIAGTAALLKTLNKNLTNNQIIDIILQSSDVVNDVNPMYQDELGTGRVNIANAINLLKISFGLSEYPEKKFDNVLLSVSSGSSLSSETEIFELHKKFGEKKYEFNTFKSTFEKGVEVIPINDNNYLAIPKNNGAPQIINLDNTGKIISSFFVDNENKMYGLNVVKGHVLNTKEEHLVVSFGNGSEPKVLILTLEGKLIQEFIAYPIGYKGGVNLSLGDLNGDGVEEIITGTQNTGGPQIRVFNFQGKPLLQFFAYDKNFRGGVNVTTSDLNGDGIDEIIASPFVNGGPQVMIFSNKGKLVGQFFAFDKNLRQGLKIKGVDINQDGVEEIVTAIYKDSKAYVKIYNYKGSMLYNFNAFENILPRRTKENNNGNININVIQ